MAPFAFARNRGVCRLTRYELTTIGIRLLEGQVGDAPIITLAEVEREIYEGRCALLVRRSYPDARHVSCEMVEQSPHWGPPHGACDDREPRYELLLVGDVHQ